MIKIILKNFGDWLNKTTQYNNNEVSENGFIFLLSQTLSLHGFGEPFLDKNLIEKFKFVLKVEFQPISLAPLPL